MTGLDFLFDPLLINMARTISLEKLSLITKINISLSSSLNQADVSSSWISLTEQPTAKFIGYHGTKYFCILLWINPSCIMHKQ